jgi:uncharacterized protein YraI
VAQHRHKRETNARRMPRAALVAAPLAVVATMSAVTMGILSAEPVGSDADLLAAGNTSVSSATLANRSEVTVSRSQPRSAARSDAKEDRAAARAEARKERQRRERREAAERKKQERLAASATLRAVRSADTRLWTTAPLNLWNGSGADATQVGVLEEGKKVLVTGRREAGRAEVVVDGVARWVSDDYLSADKPAPPGPSLGGVCANGSSIDAGRDTLYAIHDAVCANWPEITAYGTWRGDGEHGQGRAMDIMVSGATGWEVAEFLKANYSAFGIEYLIYSQNIWSVERGGEGWRGMSDRGSTTANHYDHVHVTVY